jgi:leucyl/phenylalanyl-tRNA---protein transferase
MSDNLMHMTPHVMPEIPRSYLQSIKQTAMNQFHHFAARHLLTMSTAEGTALTRYFESQPYSAELVVRGYTQGIFPSSFEGDGRITWHDPIIRGYLPITDFYVPTNVRKLLRQEKFELHVDDDMSAVIEGCSEGRSKTHINARYIDIYLQLHDMGIAHAVSAWQDGKLVGGTYGIAIGAYFVSESAFHRVRDASKVATVRLTEILADGGYTHHDTWWFSKDIEQFGGGNLTRAEFHKKHLQAIMKPARFDANTPRTLSTGTSSVS